jgi:hypothetical protein
VDLYRKYRGGTLREVAGDIRHEEVVTHMRKVSGPAASQRVFSTESSNRRRLLKKSRRPVSVPKKPEGEKYWNERQICIEDYDYDDDMEGAGRSEGWKKKTTRNSIKMDNAQGSPRRF